MLTTPRHSSKPSPLILYALAFILSFILCIPWVSAKETPKPKPQQWQIDGIVAALNDSYPKVKQYAFECSSTRSTTVDVFDRVSKFIAKQLNLSLRDFFAELKKPSSEVDQEKQGIIRPFAEVAASILSNFGGNYLAIAQQLKPSDPTVTETRPPGKHYAIAIGINQYQNLASAIASPQYAVRDVSIMHEWFSRRGFEKVDLLTNASPTDISESRSSPTQAGWQQFWEANFPSNTLSAEDTLWFYFSGYGVSRDGENYLLLADSDLEKLEETALPLTNLVKLLQNSGAGKVILLLDADLNSQKRTLSDRSSDQSTTRNFTSDQVFSLEQQFQRELSPDKGLIIFYASSPEQSAYEIQQLQQGGFTYALQEALEATQGNLTRISHEA